MHISERLAAVQQEVKAPKNQKNTHMKFNYRSAEGILEAVKPILAKHGATITLTDDIVEVAGRIYVKATATFIDHEGNGCAVNAWAREAESKSGLDVAQVTGAASSYARKYALNGLLLLDDAKQDPDSEENTRRTEADEKAPTVSQEKIDLINTMAKHAEVDLRQVLTKDITALKDAEADKLIQRLKAVIDKKEASGGA